MKNNEFVEIGSLDFVNNASDHILKIMARHNSSSISKKCRKRDKELRKKPEKLAKNKK